MVCGVYSNQFLLDQYVEIDVDAVVLAGITHLEMYDNCHGFRIDVLILVFLRKVLCQLERAPSANLPASLVDRVALDLPNLSQHALGAGSRSSRQNEVMVRGGQYPSTTFTSIKHQ